MRLYQTLDIILTLQEMLSLYIFSICFCKEPRFRMRGWKLFPPCALFAVIWVFTWLSELGAYKIPLIFIFGIVFMKICYRDTIYQIITAYEIHFIVSQTLPESVGIFLAQWIYGEEVLVQVGGAVILRWETYIIVFLIRIFIIWGIYKVCKGFQYRVQFKDCLVLTASFLVSFSVSMLDCFNYLNLSETSEMLLYALNAFICMAFLIVFLYSKNTLYLQKQAQRDKMQLLQMRQQFDYYQEKLKDEERVRSVYHDMKNHLLVLKQRTDSPETAEMIEKLQREVAVYEEYVHTGNEILYIILKEKAGIAREKRIDFSVTADLSDIDFIEPLDISTIFGNGLDNAIEASEKLSEVQRVILVKAGKVQKFFAILIENNCAEENKDVKSRTAKQDDFLHGFGSSNMRKSAEKYGGQMTTKSENGKFTLKILIPIPEKPVVHG